MIPNENSYCEIDPEVKDKWGIPVLRFHWKWSENEQKMANHMQATFRSIIEAAGGRVLGEEQHTFAVTTAPSKGFAVRISIPYHTGEELS